MSEQDKGECQQKNDRPLGGQLGWHLLETRYPFKTPWITVRQDLVEIDGKEEPIEFNFQEHPGAVGVVPLTRDGQVILIRQYRYPIDAWSLEIPAGSMHDANGASTEEVARKEVEQEIGATCGELQYIGCYYTTIGQSDQAYHIYLALDVELDRQQSTEETEQIEVRPVSASEALEMSRDGRIKDGNAALALLLCAEQFRQRGYI